MGFSCRRLQILTLATVTVAIAAPADALGAGQPTGGGAIAPAPSSQSSGGVVAAATTQSQVPAPPGAHPRGLWLSRVTISEYWATPESWFTGALVSAPGLPGKHRIDWLYSAQGVSMNGQGIGLDGRMYHVARLGSGGWVTSASKPTIASRGWLGGSPFWRAGGYWRNAGGAVTFPLQSGGWSAGTGRSYVPLPGVRFAPGPSLPVAPYQSIAVDPRVIPLGSRVYIPAYRNDGHGGWFIAQDTGGAIVGHRIDVYRTPPATPSTGGRYLTSQRVFVVKP
jgi:hypothetical protein